MKLILSDSAPQKQLDLLMPGLRIEKLSASAMQWESRGKGPKPMLDGKPIDYITVGGRVSLL